MEDSYVLQLKNPLFHDMSLWFCGMSECSPGHKVGPGVRPNYIIHFVLEGKGTFHIGDKVYEITSGQGFLIEPETVVSYVSDVKKPWTYMWIGFAGERAGKYLSDIGLHGENPVFQCVKMEELKLLLLKMFERQQISVANQYHLQSLLYEFFAVLADGIKIDTIAQEGKDNIYVREAVNFIRNNYFRGINVSDIADYISVNRSYLYKLFQASFQMSPKDFLTTYRISRAEELLTWSDLSIEGIAWSCGYNDALVFSKVFKKQTGLSPTSYRKENMKEIADSNPGKEDPGKIKKMMRV